MPIPYAGQASVDSTVYSFSKGFITELSPLGQPADSAIDINDFELLMDGTVRRRKGLLPEVGGSNITLTTASYANVTDFTNNRWSWTRWNSSTGTQRIVIQLGYYLHFFLDTGTTLSTAKEAKGIDLRNFCAGKTAATGIYVEPVSFATGNGDLIVSGKRLETFVVRENGSALSAFPIFPVVRCFWDAKDDIPMDYKPNNANGEYTKAHRFNLRSRGWRDYGESPASSQYDEGITRYIAKSDPGVNEDYAPSKAMVPYKGYFNVGNAGAASDFNPYAVDANVFGAASAPRGHIKHKLYDYSRAHRLVQQRHSDSRFTGTTYAGAADKNKPLNTFKISAWTDSVAYNWAAGGFTTITVTLTLNYDISRGGTAGSWGATPFNVEFEIVDNQYTFTDARSVNSVLTGSLDGTYTGTVTAITAGPPGTTTVTFSYNIPYGWTAFTNRTLSLGYVHFPFTNTQALNNVAYVSQVESTLTENPTGINSSNYRMQANAFYAGRLWLANLSSGNNSIDTQYSDRLYFSKVLLEDADYWKFYQANDPTAEFLNELLPSDGGVIEIPGMGTVQKMITVQNSLMVFTNRGVWEIRGSQGAFAADDYIVRKMSDIETNYNGLYNSNLAIDVDGVPVFASVRGLYTLQEDTNSGYLTMKSLTEGKIQSYWESIPYSSLAYGQLIYDNIARRIYFLWYDDTISGSSFAGSRPLNACLIYDIRLGAFFKYKIPTVTSPSVIRVIGAVSIKTPTDGTDNKNIKFVSITGAISAASITMNICDFNQTSFDDYTGLQSIPSITTAYDSQPGDWQRSRNALYIHTYMKKTETSFSPVTNPSSLTMQARWDWADNANSGNYDAAQEIYRHIRTYTPSGGGDVADGVPVIHCRNKVRGRGRSLHLYFQGAEDTDAHLLGWAIHYKGNRRL